MNEKQRKTLLQSILSDIPTGYAFLEHQAVSLHNLIKLSKFNVDNEDIRLIEEKLNDVFIPDDLSLSRLVSDAYETYAIVPRSNMRKLIIYSFAGQIPNYKNGDYDYFVDLLVDQHKELSPTLFVVAINFLASKFSQLSDESKYRLKDFVWKLPENRWFEWTFSFDDMIGNQDFLDFLYIILERATEFRCETGDLVTAIIEMESKKS